MSRLISATNPESGVINYDLNGNLTQKIDARGVQTDYVYDKLNRVTNRNYTLTGAVPPNYHASQNVSYTYRTAAPAVGALASVSTGTGADRSTTEYVDFDILGRVTRSIQETDNVRYGDGTDANHWMTYSYNLSGALIEQQYPSGRVVRNTLDTNGDLKAVLSSKRTHPQLWAYANGFKYNAAGAVTSMQLGNGNWESTKFNERLQPTQIALGTTENETDLLKLDYQYGDLEWNGTVRPASNNGNVAKQTIKVEGVGTTPGFTAVQNYDYDSLNRIQIASETLTPTTGTAESWVQEFKYDRFGNRKFNEQTTTTLPRECGTAPSLTVCPDDPKINPSANPNDNRLVGHSFDAAGNTARDAQDRKFTYDSENKQTKVESLYAGTQTVAGKVGEYWYDGDGKRIKKRAYEDNVLTEETIFVYDAAGKLVAEYSNEVASQEYGKVAYLTNDHLGSPRINTDENGAVTARHDYHPFGEEIASSKRVAGIGYGDESGRKQFTGYERDGETGLDFAQARYYAQSLGRYASPDPVMISVNRLTDPQRLNLYVYVRNNPYRFTDPYGEDVLQLGEESEKTLGKEIDDVEMQLKKDKNNTTLQEKLATLRNNLEWVKAGNKVIGAWLAALNKRGEGQGMTLNDFKISTTPQSDLVNEAKAFNSLGGNQYNLEKTAKMGADDRTTAAVIGGQIYILGPHGAFEQSFLILKGGKEFGFDDGPTVPNSDVFLFGGSALIHERDHRDNKADEATAYSTQIDFLIKMNTTKQFKNQRYFNEIKQGLENERARHK